MELTGPGTDFLMGISRYFKLPKLMGIFTAKTQWPDFQTSFHILGKSQTIVNFTVSGTSQILPRYREIARRLSQI